MTWMSVMCAILKSPANPIEESLYLAVERLESKHGQCLL